MVMGDRSLAMHEHPLPAPKGEVEINEIRYVFTSPKGAKANLENIREMILKAKECAARRMAIFAMDCQLPSQLFERYELCAKQFLCQRQLYVA